MRVEIEAVNAARDRAVIQLIERDRTTESGLEIVKLDRSKDFDPFDDYEMGTVASLGAGEGWEPLEIGDTVIVRAISGGAAGADIGPAMGKGRGEVVVVDREEIVCIVE